MARLIRSISWSQDPPVLLHDPGASAEAEFPGASMAAAIENDPPSDNQLPQSDEALIARRIEARARAAERRQFSRLLHDQINQSLTAVNVKLAVLRARAGKDVQEELSAAQRLLEKTMDEVQRLSQDLHPSAVEDLGLVAALRSHIKNFCDRTGVSIELKAQERTDPANVEHALAIYQSVKTLLDDLARTGVSRIIVLLTRRHDTLRLEAKTRLKSASSSRTRDVVPDLSRFYEQALVAGGKVKFRGRSNEATVSALFPIVCPSGDEESKANQNKF